MEEEIVNKRKRLIFRSWHRGTREIDLMLGGFADAHIPQMDVAGLAQYDAFLTNSDPDIFNWMTGAEPLPPSEESAVTDLMLRYFKVTP